MSTDPEREALLPCPFCGGEARLSRHPKGYDLAHCADETCDPGHLTFAAPEKWNRRAAGWMPRPEPGSADAILAAIRTAAETLAADEDRLRKLRVFSDYWPTIEAYSPPPEVEDDVSEIVLAMVALANALRALGTGDATDGR